MKETSDKKIDWKKQYTLHEIIDMIQPNHIEWFATICLCLLCISPLINGVCRDYSFTLLYTCICGVGLIGYGVSAALLWLRKKNVRVTGIEKEKNFMLIFFALLLLWSVFSTIASTNQNLSLIGTAYRKDGLITYFAYGGILLLALRIRSKKCRCAVLNCLVAVATFMALVCFTGSDRIICRLGMWQDKGIFENVNHYGYYLCIAVLLSIGLLLNDDRKWNSIKNVLIGVVRLAEIALLSNSLAHCVSLGPLLGVIAGIILLIVFCGFINKKLYPRLIAIVVFTMITFGLSCIGYWNLKEEANRLSADASTAVAAVSGSIGEQEGNGAGSGRLGLWRAAYGFVWERPLFGYGPDNLGERYMEEPIDYGNDRPHCVLLQIAASLGIPALIFYIGALWCLLWRFVKQFRNMSSDSLVLYCAVGAYLVSSLTGNSMFYTTPFYFLTIGVCYASVKKKNEQNNEGENCKKLR